MKKFLSIFMSMALILTFSACGGSKETASKKTVKESKTEQQTNDYAGTLKAVSEAKVIPSGTGQIIECPYAVGDKVSKGDLLYKLDDNGIADNIATTKNSIAKADISINTAQENVNNLKVYSPANGILHDFSIKQGERVNATKIGAIYDESTALAVVPFNETQKNSINVGDAATVTSADLMSSVSGKVTRIYDARSSEVEGSALYDVEISLSNGGGLYSGLSVIAKINGMTSPASGIIKNADYASVVSRGSGNARNVYVKEGQRVKRGQLLLDIDNTSINATLSRAKLDRSDLSIKLASLEKDYANLFVYAPASGKITLMSKKLNDSIVSKSESVMTIADSSVLIMNLNVSKNTLNKITQGMSVRLDVSGYEGESVTGTVTEISDKEVVTGNTKAYSVKIEVENIYDIQPGTVANVNFGGNK
ncbi:MAG: HlyD family efflux transporter periplasmic adaptor subunit [Bacillota bacterium]|nr:HlyD family efflux transporter periplasmic adaptor subunit [Bacillota bacterium]